MQFIFFIKYKNNNKAFLRSTINWKFLNIEKINIKIMKVKLICDLINSYFNFKIRIWQINITNVIKKKIFV